MIVVRSKYPYVFSLQRVTDFLNTSVETDRQVPILTSFTSSQGGGHPFKVSIHNWDTPSFSKELQDLDKPGKALYHEARVIIDGILVAYKGEV